MPALAARTDGYRSFATNEKISDLARRAKYVGKSVEAVQQPQVCLYTVSAHHDQLVKVDWGRDLCD